MTHYLVEWFVGFCGINSCDSSLKLLRGIHLTIYRLTDKYIFMHITRQIDNQTDGWTDGQMVRQTSRVNKIFKTLD